MDNLLLSEIHFGFIGRELANDAEYINFINSLLDSNYNDISKEDRDINKLIDVITNTDFNNGNNQQTKGRLHR